MDRYNLKNDRRNKKYEHDELDVTRLSRELIRPKSANYGYRIMPDWIYAALFLAILALVILLVGGL